MSPKPCYVEDDFLVGQCPECIACISLLSTGATLRAQVIVEGGWRNRISDPVMAKLGIPVMRTWNLSVPLWEYHHGFQVGLGFEEPTT